MIYVGNQGNARDTETLKKLGIGGVVNCASSTVRIRPVHYKKSKIECLYVDTNDLHNFPILTKNYTFPVKKFIERIHAQGKNVMIHCMAGVNRSATIGKFFSQFFSQFFP